MDATVIHNDNRVWCRVWLHPIKKSINEHVEHSTIKCPLNNIAVEDPFCQRQCRKNRKSGEPISNPPTSWDCKYYIPLSTAEERLMSCSSATYCPGTATVCCSTVHSTFINKNELFWCILANTKGIVSPCFNTSLQCSLAKLSSGQTWENVVTNYTPFSWSTHPLSMFSR